jgi:tRNA dimethylallyltransferase
MFRAGVRDEVAAVLRAPLSATAARIHGLQDVEALIRGEIDEPEAIRRLDVRTRQYAKRQRVWMRRLPGLLPARDAADIAARL